MAGKMFPSSILDRIRVHRAVIAILVMLQSCSRLSRKGGLYLVSWKSREDSMRLLLQLESLAQSVKNLPAVQETQVRSLGQEDPLEKEMATHSSILAWKISWTEEPGGLQSMGSQKVEHDWVTNTYLLSRGEG